MIAKCTTILLSVLVCVEMAVFGGIVSTASPSVGVISKDLPVMAVSDTVYVPEEVEDEAEEVIAEVEDEAEWESDYVDYDYDDSADAVYYDYDYGYDDSVYSTYYDYYYDDGGLVPYDGSGYYDANLDEAWMSGSDLMFYGRLKDGGSGYTYTYYSENVLPGGGLDIPGRHVNDEGYVCDSDGNICIASDNLPYGTVVNVPFGDGTAVVYDCGSGHGNLDVYTSW